LNHSKTRLLLRPGDTCTTAKALIRLMRQPGQRQQSGHAGRAPVTGRHATTRHGDGLHTAYGERLRDNRGWLGAEDRP
jgi:hypothetical protein